MILDSCESIREGKSELHVDVPLFPCPWRRARAALQYGPRAVAPLDLVEGCYCLPLAS